MGTATRSSSSPWWASTSRPRAASSPSANPSGASRDPGRRFRPEITALTGIADGMVAGHAIDPAEVEAFLGAAVLVVAHNAGFDRRFAERFCAAFAQQAWLMAGNRVGERGIRGRDEAGEPRERLWLLPSRASCRRRLLCGRRTPLPHTSRQRAPCAGVSARIRTGAEMENPRGRRPIRIPRMLEKARLPLGLGRKWPTQGVGSSTSPAMRSRPSAPFSAKRSTAGRRHRGAAHRRLRPLPRSLLSGRGSAGFAPAAGTRRATPAGRTNT
jgi:hypothetical protein